MKRCCVFIPPDGTNQQVSVCMSDAETLASLPMLYLAELFWDFPLEGCQMIGSMGMAFSWRGCSLQTIPPVGRRSPLLRTRGYVILWGKQGGSVGSTFDSGRMYVVRVPPAELNISAFPPVLRDWVIKGLGMSSLVYATGHIKDPVPLIAMGI